MSYAGFNDQRANNGAWNAQNLIPQGGGTPPAQQHAPTTPTQTAAPGSVPAPPTFNFNPSTIQGQFPGGVPQVAAGQITGVPSVYQGMGGAQGYSPQTAINATSAYLQPQFQQQDAALQQALANSGIVGGSTARAFADLGTQQQSQMQNDIQPYLLSLQQLQQGGLQSDQGAYLQGAESNLNSLNQTGMFNASNLLNTAGMDANTYNGFLQYLAGLQNTDWLAQLNAGTSLQTAGLGAKTGAYQPIYQQPQPTNLAPIAQAVGGAFQVPPVQASPIGTGYPYPASGSETGKA